MREETYYQFADFTLVIDSEENTLALFYGERKVVAVKRQFNDEATFKERTTSLKSKLQMLNDKIKELKNG